MAFRSTHAWIFAMCALLTAAPIALAEPAGPATDAVAFRVKRGVNLSHWFAQIFTGSTFSPQYIASKYNGRDFAAIRAMGLDHVRLPVEPELMMAQGDSGELNEEAVALLEAALRQLLAHDLAVIVDCHPKAAFKNRLGSEPAAVETAARWWERFAARLAWTDPARVAFQLMNEPAMDKAATWLPIQKTLAAAARRGAPRHTLIATGHAWSDISTLSDLQPLSDGNVLYAFHMYRSSAFTHQGATWGNAKWRELRGVPYPSSPERVAPLLATIQDPEARRILEEYGQKQLNTDSIADLIASAAEWAQQHGVGVICTEFGVYRPYADPSDRAAWTRDVRSAFDEHHIPWTMWDYSHGFGLINRDAGEATLPENLLTALGLSRKDAPSWIAVTD